MFRDSEPRDFDQSCRIRRPWRVAHRAFSDNAFVSFLHTARVLRCTQSSVISRLEQKAQGEITSFDRYSWLKLWSRSGYHSISKHRPVCVSEVNHPLLSMSLRKAAAIARAAAKSQLSSDEDEGSDGWKKGDSSKPRVKARTKGRSSGDGSGQKKRGRPRALTVGQSGTGPDSPQPTPKARKSLDSPRKLKGTKRPQSPTTTGLDSELSELSSLEDPVSPTHQKTSPTPSQPIPERVNRPPPSTGQDISKHKRPHPPVSSRSLISSASFTLGAPPKMPADTSRVRNILSGVLGSGKSVLGRTISSPNITFSPPTISFSQETWNRDKLGSCVWVLVGRSGHPRERRGEGEAYWWPAEVISFTFNHVLSLRGIRVGYIPARSDPYRCQVLRTHM